MKLELAGNERGFGLSDFCLGIGGVDVGDGLARRDDAPCLYDYSRDSSLDAGFYIDLV